MDAVLMSIKPEYTEKIFNGKKQLELRKIAPRCPAPYIVYVYETKGLYISESGFKYNGEGAVVGKFIVTATAIIRYSDFPFYAQRACLSVSRMLDYAGERKNLTALKISEPRRYDKPFKLSALGLTRPPQSWQYLRDIKDVIDVE